MIDIDKIEAAANAATPGPWAVHPMAPNAVHQPRYECWIPASKDDAQHIATANPATVLEMVSMIRERDAVLKQALEVLGLIGGEDEPHHDDKIRVIAAIKGVLK